MQLKEIEDLLKLGKQYGVKSIKCHGINVEIEFSDKLLIEQPLTNLGIKSDPLPTEDEFLFMSGIPLTEEEIKAKPPTT